MTKQASVEHQRELVKRLLQKLPESERTVVTLYYLAEMKSEKTLARFWGYHRTQFGVGSAAPAKRLERARTSCSMRYLGSCPIAREP